MYKQKYESVNQTLMKSKTSMNMKINVFLPMIYTLVNEYDTEENHHSRNEQESTNQFESTQNNSHLIGRHEHNTQKTEHKKDSLLTEIESLESRLFHQIILKTELSTEKEEDKIIIKKLSEPIFEDINEILEDIKHLETKLNNGLLLNHIEKREIKEKILEKRMEELANVRVLWNIYRHHEYRLLLSTLHIVLLYQDLGCHQQAITHLESIREINSKYRNKNLDSEYLHSIILTLHALSENELDFNKKSIENLNAAIEIQERLKADFYDVKDFFTLNLVTKVLTTTKQYEEGISFGKMALMSAEKLFTDGSIEYCTALRSLAEAEAADQEFENAVKHLKKAIEILECRLPEKEETIIEFYTKLTELTLKRLNSTQVIEQNNNHFEPYLEVLRKKYQVIENTYGYRDKRAIKDKRHLASSLLKYQHIDEAEEELEDILEIEQTVYGEKSVEVAKTLKLLGSIAMTKNETQKAEKLLRKSMAIFHDQGQVLPEKEVQSKLLILTGKAKFVNSK